MLRAEERVLKGEEWESEKEAAWSKNFFFIQAADTQLGLMYNFGTDGSDGISYPDSQWDSEVELCKKSVEILNNMQPRPAFFVVCGDLVDAFGEKYPETRARQEADLKKVYSKLDPAIPMVCVCGNHDVGNTPTPETIARYKESFGDDYFSFYKNGVAFLVLNSQFYADSTQVVGEYKAHETWLEQELKKAQEVGASHVVIFQHIPWFINDWGEDKQYFNLEKDLRVAKLDQLQKAGVRKIFCGHYHRNAGGVYKDLEVVVTTAIGCQIPHPDTDLKDEHGMRLVKVTKKEITHSFHPLHSFPTRIDI